jgi:hypothetical protein
VSESVTATLRYEQAFAEVMEMYVDLKSSDGKTWNQVYGNPHTHGKNPLLVKPSDQDFLCDVELSFRSVLPTAADVHALTAILTGNNPVDPAMKRRVTQRVGRELIRRQIFPTKLYFQGKEIQRER